MSSENQSQSKETSQANEGSIVQEITVLKGKEVLGFEGWKRRHLQIPCFGKVAHQKHCTIRLSTCQRHLLSFWNRIKTGRSNLNATLKDIKSTKTFHRISNLRGQLVQQKIFVNHGLLNFVGCWVETWKRNWTERRPIWTLTSCRLPPWMTKVGTWKMKKSKTI